MQNIENRTFDEILPGDSASLIRTLSHKDIEVFAIMSGDVNPAHVDAEFASSDIFHKIVAHGMWGGSLISTVLGTQLPGPGTIYVDQSLHSTLDAAALCKMADRGQIIGGIVDGPLAFDNAVSEEAARMKDIVSPVAGRADILVVPDLEAGNMLAKQLEYLADAQISGIVLGARVPIVLTSRSDKTLARLGSCAIALLLARQQTGAPQ